jgi:predicted PurR-regulated permease PerM
MEDVYFKKIITTIILATLVVMSFLLLKPILLSIISGLILAFIFMPVYDWMDSKIQKKNLSAILISLLLIFLIMVPIWFLTPILIDQSLKAFFAIQEIDFTKTLQSFLPSLFSSEEFSLEVASILRSFTSTSINSFTNYLSGIIINFPILMLQLFVVLVTFYFVLRDKEGLILYIKSLLPFSKEVENKLFKQTEGITKSVLYGQFVIGIVQGLIAGLGFFIFGVSNALILTLLACLAGILPIVGTSLIWVPVVVYLFIDGNSFPAIGIIIFGLVSTFIDNILKPVIVSHRTNVPMSIILIGMIGGYFLFGILGFILGPLILSYLLIILEIYRNKKIPGILIQEPAGKLRISI